MAIVSDVPGEEYYQIGIGSGMYTSELPSNIPDGFSAVCYNMVATGDSLENRVGIKRSSVDWKVADNANVINSTLVSTDDLYTFNQISPWSGDSSKVAFAWGSWGLILPGLGTAGSALNLVRAAGATGTGDGFCSVAIAAGAVVGICQYQDTIYYSVEGRGIFKITAINWATDSVTSVAVAGTDPGTIRGLFTFKDRLWGWSNGTNRHKLYFTDLPTVGGQPETWAFASNVVPFVGPNGAGQIEKVIPLGNKLIVFTTNGLFTLLVEGAPASWILRVLDSKSIATSSRCAFETNGIVYYINTKGVWATNGLSCTKLSAVIDDQFFLAKGQRTHMLCLYEDGMVASISKIATNSTFYDAPNCRVFFSQLDPIGWAEWNINSHDLGSSPYRYANICSMTDKIPTYLNKEPTVYVMASITDSTEAVNSLCVIQLLVMDGGSDQWVTRANTVETLPVGIYLKSKHFDGDNQYRIKHAKKGMIELFTSDAEHDFDTSWDIDASTSVATEVRDVNINDFTVGVGSNLVQIRNEFHYRRASFNLRAYLQSDNSQIKIKNMAIAQDTNRAEFELVR